MDRRTKVILAIVLWFAAIALAAAVDRPVAMWLRNSGIPAFLESHAWLKTALKVPGEFYFTVIVAFLVAAAHPLRWRAGGFLLLATLVSGLNGLTKWIAGRTRPFKLEPLDTAWPFALHPFRGGLPGLFDGRNLCFPSGHAALAFATAAAVAILWPDPRRRWLRWTAYAVAGLVALERVAENAHWLSDVVAAAALGVGGVYLIHWIVTKVVDARGEDARRVASRLTSAHE
jgi:membrane-associated phospholipid phosphatase